MRSSGPKIDLTGKRFTRWTVAEWVEGKWRCVCDCGNEALIATGTLNAGASKSCGCGHREIMRGLKTVHGGKGTPEYRIWKHMRGRCNQPNDSHYKNYGGRGIKVCERWDSFANFLADVGPRPSNDHSIERKDVNGNYEPDNVEWILKAEQARNTTKTVYVLDGGARKKLVDLALEVGVSANTMHQRVRRGSFGMRRCAGG